MLAMLPLFVVGQQAFQISIKVVVDDRAYLSVPVGGLERTDAKASVSGKSLIVTTSRAASESNATQLTVPTITDVKAGDVLVARFRVRGRSGGGSKQPAHIEFLFEGSTDPWTKSVTHPVAVGTDWKQVLVPFRAAIDYPAGGAMASVRFAFGSQTVELQDLAVSNFGPKENLEEFQNAAIETNRLGRAEVVLNPSKVAQTLQGMGGNFCQPRYGASEPMDSVGRYVLDHLNVRHARVGLPLNVWAAERGRNNETGPAKASLQALQILAKRKIPLTVSIWEGPKWMLPGETEQAGKVVPPELYEECANSIAEYLVTARDKYGANVETFSFNEADYGINFKFSSQTIADFIRIAGPIFRSKGLRTKFLIGDTGNGANCAPYAKPLLEDPALRPYLGPISLHSWDVLGVVDNAYVAISELGKAYKKPIWCLEAGHDAQLWQAKDPWGTWDNAIRNAQAYVRTLNLTHASLIDYWTYQDNYPLVSGDGKPYPVFRVMQQMEGVIEPGAQVISATSNRDDLMVLSAKSKKGIKTLLVNPIGAGTATLSGLPIKAMVTLVTSDQNGQLRSDRMARRTSAKGELTVSLPARSVVSVAVTSPK